MKGLELSRAYFETYGLPMLNERFPQLKKYLAAGLVGAGSECYGFDDESSRDHDFEPGFCLFLPGEDLVDRRAEFQLERAYAKLPREFMGVRRPDFSPAGGPRKGVLRTADFFASKTGSPNGILPLRAWFSLPETGLSEVTNGEVFYDGPGIFTEIRRRFASPPLDVVKKKLCAHLWLAAQAGQYNYPRSLRHKESGGAQLSVYEFVLHASDCVFLLNRAYAPFYKWRLRALSGLSLLPQTAAHFEFLISYPNTPEYAEKKTALIEEIARAIAEETARQHLAAATSQMRVSSTPFSKVREADVFCAEGAAEEPSQTMHFSNAAPKREDRASMEKEDPAPDFTDLASLAFSVNDAVCDPSLRNEDLLFGA